MVQMHSNNRNELKEIRAGDIAACIGLKDVTTGDTLCDANDEIILERMDFPEPVISVAVEPKSKADQEKMSIALGKLAQEDPSFRVNSDEESGQTIISGMGELHLDVLVDRMKGNFLLKLILVNLKLLIEKQLHKQLKLKVNMYAKVVEGVNMAMFG